MPIASLYYPEKNEQFPRLAAILSLVRYGNIPPQVMAALRNTVIGLMGWASEINISAGCRRFAAQPWSALALIDIDLKS